MTERGLQELSNILSLMDAPYGNTWTAAKLALYARALQHVPDEVALAVAERLSVTTDYRPTPNQLVTAIAKEIDPAPDFEEASRQLTKYLFGKGPSPHPAVGKLIRALGGSAVIGKMTDTEFENKARRSYELEAENHIGRIKNSVVAGHVGPSVYAGFQPVYEARTDALPSEAGVSPSRRIEGSKTGCERSQEIAHTLKAIGYVATTEEE